MFLVYHCVMLAVVVPRTADVVLRAPQKFKELVEGLLETHLTEIGVAPEDFVEICSTARNSRDVNKVVFDQILAVDDFLSACLRLCLPWLRFASCVRACLGCVQMCDLAAAL